MIRTYLKQAWTLMKQHKLFSSIYVLGTGLSIAFSMVLFIVLYVKFAPIYPEYNRDRILVVGPSNVVGKHSNHNSSNMGISPKAADLFRSLPHLDKLTLCLPISTFFNNKVALPQQQREVTVSPYYVDANYWEVFNFNFLSGKPFDAGAVASGLAEVVLNESMANKIFASTDVTGKYIQLDGNDVKVVGVVKDVSSVTPNTAADLYLPLGYNQMNHMDDRQEGLLGNMRCYLLAAQEADKDLLRQEVLEAVKKYNDTDKDYTTNLMGQPDDYWKSSFRGAMTSDSSILNQLRSMLYILLALLIIPTLNLCGMNSSRMSDRLAEIGVRKAYGASNKSLLGQILTENFVMTFMGGFFGLLFAYLIAITSDGWILHLFDTIVFPNTVQTYFTVEMLLNPVLFLVVLCICLVLNVLSALIPALSALRHPIIQAIQTKR